MKSGRSRGFLPQASVWFLFLLLGACAQQSATPQGDPVYQSLAPRAEVLARNTVQEALETARSSSSLTWSYVEDGSRGEITPLRTYRTSAGFYCREYVEVVESGAEQRHRRQRTACRDDDGLWKPIRL